MPEYRAVTGRAERKKYKVIAKLEFEVEADDIGEAIKNAEAKSFSDRLGNLPEYDYKNIIVSQV